MFGVTEEGNYRVILIYLLVGEISDNFFIFEGQKFYDELHCMVKYARNILSRYITVLYRQRCSKVHGLRVGFFNPIINLVFVIREAYIAILVDFFSF